MKRAIVLFVMLMSGCVSVPSPSSKVSTGTQGMVSAAQPEATRAAVGILEQGGNAADAAVAAGFAISVVEPSMNSIGGRSQVLVRDAAGKYTALNGMTEIPSSYERPESAVRDGYGVIATPGVVAALARLHEEQGSLPWEGLLQPAIELAEQGFELLPGEAARHEFGLADVVGNSGFQKNILVNGKAAVAGAMLRQPALAKTLRQIAAQGPDAFYQGDVAEQIAADMAANDGFVTLTDLKNYRAIDGRYVTTRYRDVEVHTIAAPAGGGLVVKALNLLENFDLASLNDLEWAAVVNQALALSLMTMRTDYEERDLELVVSKDWAKVTAEQILVPNIRVATAAEPPLPMIASHDWSGDSWGEDSHHTTHFVTADCAGMTVSITQTIGPLFGSKVMTPELGFAYASTMGSYLATAAQSPGSRPRTTIAPTIVTKDGEVIMVLGAAGGLRILSGIVQTISRVVDQGLALDEAIAAPRVHPATTADEVSGTQTIETNIFHAEFTADNGWQQGDVERWQAAGFAAKPNSRFGAFARVHALARFGDSWQGVADLDWEGAAKAPNLASCPLDR